MGVQPGNPIVGGIQLRIPAIRSPNYVAGVSGWTINIDGSAEFNNVTVRGTLAGTDYEISALGIIFYSGTPALGNVTFSASAMGGTDRFGNTIPAGISIIPTILTMPAMSNGWSVAVGGFAKYSLDPNGNLVTSWRLLNPGTVTDGTTVWAAGTFTGNFLVPKDKLVPCYSDGVTAGETAAFKFLIDGSVQCFGFSGAATRGDLYATIPLTF